MEERATIYLAVARVAAVVGMAFAAAIGILLLIGGWLALGVQALAAAVPIFVLMRQSAEPTAAKPPEAESEGPVARATGPRPIQWACAVTRHTSSILIVTMWSARGA
jgi:hypothetical protein